MEGLPTDNSSVPLVKLSITALVLCTIFAGLRTWVRLRIQKSFFLDDWFMFVTLALFYVHMGLQFQNVRHGFGKHIYLVTIDEFVYSLKLYWYEMLVFAYSLCFLRLSVGTLLLRVIPKESVPFASATRAGLYFVLGFNIIWTIGMTIWLCLGCRPISYFWTRFKHGKGHCVGDQALDITVFQVYTSLSGAQDLAIALLPGAVVWQMRIPKRSRLIVHLLMVMGCIASISSWVRLYYYKVIDSIDFLHDAAPFSKWSTIETSMGFVAGNAATLRPLMRKISLPSFLKREKSELGAANPPSFSSKKRWRGLRRGPKSLIHVDSKAFPPDSSQTGSENSGPSVKDLEAHKELKSKSEREGLGVTETEIE